MPIDGCEYSFRAMAHVVLPGYMSALRERMACPIPLADFGIKDVGPVALQRRLGLDYDPSGCYVLIDEGRPVYVGISRGVIKRLRDHIRGSDHMVATLAYRIAANPQPSRKDGISGYARHQISDTVPGVAQLSYGLSTGFVEITNPLELYLFEPFCAMELDTGFDTGGWNTFMTH